MSFPTKPARIREEMLDLATSSEAVEFRLCTLFIKLFWKQDVQNQVMNMNMIENK